MREYASFGFLAACVGGANAILSPYALVSHPGAYIERISKAHNK